MALTDDLRKVPLIKLLIPFIIGIFFRIFLQYHISISDYLVFCLFCFLTVVFLLILFIRKIMQDYHRQWIFGFILYIVLFLSGAALTSLHDTRPHTVFLIQNEKKTVIANVLEPPKETKKTYRTIVRIMAVKKDRTWNKTRSKALLYFYKDSLSGTLKAGHQLIFETVFREIPSPANPEEFNFSEYMSYRGVYVQAYLEKKQWRTIDQEQGPWLQIKAYQIREKLLEIYKKYGLKDNEYSVVSALTLGDRNKLDERIIQSYSGTGVTHILSISGLHVGIICLFLNYIFFFLEKYKSTRILKTVIILFFLWSLAFVTGLSPSVMRSATMFSFILIGKNLNRPVPIYNSLSLSAFFLLLMNPFLIMDVGFQLSYLAVAGIVFFYPRIYPLYGKAAWITDKIWALLVVSFSAQLVTCPLVLFYFHQFPNYFLITNLIVIPLVFIIIHLALLLLIFSFFTPVAAVLAKLLFWNVKGMNIFISFMEQLPFALSDNIFFTATETLMLYVILGLIMLFMLYHKKYCIHGILTMIIMLLVLNIQQKYIHVTHRKFIVYSVRQKSVYSFVDGENQIIFYRDSTDAMKKWLKNNIMNHSLSIGTNKRSIIDLDKQDFNSSHFPEELNKHLFVRYPFFRFYNKKICVLTNRYISSEIRNKNERFNVDYLIIPAGIKISLTQVFSAFNPKRLIFDSSHSERSKRKWERECKQYSTSYYFVNEKGAFLADI